MKNTDQIHKKNNNLSLKDKLFVSQRTYVNKFLKYWILFQPDYKGLPIIIDAFLYDIYNFFTQGASIFDVVNKFSKQSNCSTADLKTSIEFLFKNGFLKTKIDSLFYTAKPFPNFDSIKSLSIWLHLTNECNLKCEYCFIKDKNSSTMKNSTMNDVINFIHCTINKYSNLKTIAIKFSGGEPTLFLKKIKSFRSSIEKKLAKSKVRIKYSILSNGTLINDKLIDEMKTNNIAIGISIDGYGVEGHDVYRRFKSTNLGSWDIVNNNISKLLQHGIKPYIMATISKDSSYTLKELMSWIFSKGLKTRLSVVRQPDSKTWQNSKIEHAKYSDVLIQNFENTFQELEKNQYQIDLMKGNPFEICELHFKNPSFTTSCEIGVNHLVVDENGLLASCPMCIHEQHQKLSEDLFHSIRNTFEYSPEERNKNINKNSCLHCKWFPICVGGCSVTNQRLYNHPFAKTPLHKFYQYAIPRYIEFYAKKLFQQAQNQGITDFHILG